MTRPSIFLAGCAAALGLAACGGARGSTAAGATTTPARSPVKVAECMRAHGVSDFPDPSNTSGQLGFSVQISSPQDTTVTVNGVTLSGPAFQAAEKTCGFGTGRRHPLSEAQRQGMFESARCMRSHGVPNFPDPTFGPRGLGVIVRPDGVDHDSPAFQKANRECNHVGVPIPGGG